MITWFHQATDNINHDHIKRLPQNNSMTYDNVTYNFTPIKQGRSKAVAREAVA